MQDDSKWIPTFVFSFNLSYSRGLGRCAASAGHPASAIFVGFGRRSQKCRNRLNYYARLPRYVLDFSSVILVTISRVPNMPRNTLRRAYVNVVHVNRMVTKIWRGNNKYPTGTTVGYLLVPVERRDIANIIINHHHRKRRRPPTKMMPPTPHPLMKQRGRSP